MKRARAPLAVSQNAVSIITCTKRPECLKTLFENYARQKYAKKELIIILNNDKLRIDSYVEAAKAHKNVRVYRKPGRLPLGACLNYGVKLARYGLIAKFDDDDYYAPAYLADSVRTMLTTKADIVGKRAHYMYLSGKKRLLLRYPNKANQKVPLVQGATLLVKRSVFGRGGFPRLNRGECVKFCANSRAKGYRIFAGSPANFLAIRQERSKGHTWKVSDTALMSRNAKVLKERQPLSAALRTVSPRHRYP
ncbi:MULTISPECIES: glycosyltransferase family 2 protein [Paenibacillus]|uniref:glycosyltransferase family 2 protein n=1 Tax=Paenibacillus TaxID=44249 RepID=UPI002FE15E57